MYRNEKTRLFGKPKSLEDTSYESVSKFTLDINDCKSNLMKKEDIHESKQMILVRLIDDNIVKEYVKSKNYDGFLNFVTEKLELDSEYYKLVSYKNISAEPQGDPQVWTNIYYIAEAVAVALVGVLAVIDVVGSEPVKQASLLIDIIAAANLAGGKEFCMGVTKSINKEIKKLRKGNNLNVVESY